MKLKQTLLRLRKALAIVVSTSIIVSGSVSNGYSLSVTEEKELGEKLLYTIRASFPLLDDPDLHLYINNIGQEVLEVAGIQFFEYHFYIVESNQFNAFAAPSGLIFFYSKLIESMNSEDELVSVLAHEIGHIVKRHLASRAKKGAIINIASMGAALAAIALGGGAVGTGLFAGSMAAGQSAQLYFSRQDEAEADQLAYQWMVDLHRDTLGQKRMLQTMRRITRYRSGQVPQYLLTHPDPEARLDYVEALISADARKTEPVDEAVNFEFLRFKYRIMSLTDKGSTTRAYLAGKFSDSRSSDFEVAMSRYGLSQIDRQQNNFEQSLKQLDEVIAHFPDKNILQVDKGIVLGEMGNYSQAHDIFEDVLRVEPHNLFAKYHLARVLDKIGEKDRAIELLQEVSMRIPEFSEAYFELGRILSKQGQALPSRYYLGKFNLYEGKLKLAKANFSQVAASADVDAELKARSEEFLELISRLEK
jgi:predicted Zn-dependent protease